MKGSGDGRLGRVRLLLFDMDGVVTQERRYWDCAALTAFEVFETGRFFGAQNPAFDPSLPLHRHRRPIQKFLPDPLIVSFKERAINSNWDLCHLVTAVYLVPFLIEGLRACPETIRLIQREGPTVKNLKRLARCVPTVDGFHRKRKLWMARFLKQTRSLRGFQVIDHLNAFVGKALGVSLDVFQFGDPLWTVCQRIFQEWYLGSRKRGKPGLIHEEIPLVPQKRLVRIFEELREAGFVLGVATGRPYREIMIPLKKFGVWKYFDRKHLCTYTELSRAKKVLTRNGIHRPIGKPHPFSFLKAVFPGKSDLELERMSREKRSHPEVLVVGDAIGDILGAKTLGGVSVCVLTGAAGKKGRKDLAKYKPDFFIPDVSRLPTILGLSGKR